MNSLFQYFQSALTQFPNNVAIIESNGDKYTFHQVNEIVESYCSRFTNSSIDRKAIVGILLPKSIDAYCLQLAALKLGVVYIPLDSDAPVERISTIMAEAGIQYVITTIDKYNLLIDRLEMNKMDQLNENLLIALPLHPRDVEMDASTSFLFFTSGSTGKPKGVQISTIGVISFIEWASQTLSITPKDVFCSIAPFHFDLSVIDLFLAMKSASAILLIDNITAKKPESILKLCESNQVTVIYSTPTLFRNLVEYGKPHKYSVSKVKYCIFAGEVFPIEQLKKTKDYFSQATFMNWYGPTETNVCTSYELPHDFFQLNVDSVPLGLPCSHIQLKLVNSNLQECQANEQGEILVSGKAVTKGYLNAPELNKSKFLFNEDGHSWYRTGDFAVLMNGLLWFKGRKDRMVKRNGIRIELDEIENAINHLPEVKGCACLAKQKSVSTEIIAFVVFSQNKSVIQLKADLLNYLPSNMLPDRIVFLDKIPQTSTGKTAYSQLYDLC